MKSSSQARENDLETQTEWVWRIDFGFDFV